MARLARSVTATIVNGNRMKIPLKPSQRNFIANGLQQVAAGTKSLAYITMCCQSEPMFKGVPVEAAIQQVQEESAEYSPPTRIFIGRAG